MNIYTRNLLGEICCALFTVLVKALFIAAAIWMMMNGWNGCAMASMIGAILGGWSFKSDKPGKEKEGRK